QAGVRMRHPRENAESIGKNVKPLVGADAGKIADGERFAVRFGARSSMPGQVQTWMDHVNSLPRDREVLGHELGVIPACGNEAVDLPAVCANQSQAFAAKRLGQRFEVKI